MSEDGSVLACAISATCAALIDAAIPLATSFGASPMSCLLLYIRICKSKLPTELAKCAGLQVQLMNVSAWVLDMMLGATSPLRMHCHHSQLTCPEKLTILDVLMVQLQ